MRRLVWCALAALAACGAEVKPPVAPLDQIRLPTGLAVHGGRLLVASSNNDLLYEEATGGTLLALDASSPTAVEVDGAVAVRSFAGDLALARVESTPPGSSDPESCGTALLDPFGATSALAIFGTRGSNTLNVVAVAGDGALSCGAPGARCGIAAPFDDPFAVGVACRTGSARAFFGFLAAPDGVARVAELDLVSGSVRSLALGAGPARGFAYDRLRDRLYVTGLATGVQTPLRWIDLAGCTFGAAPAQGGCAVGSATLPGAAGNTALELRAIALGHPVAGQPRRAYVTARRYDASAAAAAGGRNTDYGGALLVVDLVDAADGGVDPQVVEEWDIGAGAQDVRVLPRRGAPGDVVAVVTATELLVVDTHSGAMARFGPSTGSGGTGAPVVGHDPFGLAVDPQLAGGLARVWVASYSESFVTPVDVPVETPDRATFAGGTQRRISGRTP